MQRELLSVAVAPSREDGFDLPSNWGSHLTDGFARLRPGQGPANSPLDCLLGRPFRIRPPNTQTHKKTNP